MKTFYVLYDAFTRSFVRAGRAGGYTTSLNAAKHFTSEWSAKNFRDDVRRVEFLHMFIIKKICHQ